VIAAKQEAFEEAARLSNQFRALDDDEVEFLTSVAESSRAQEEAVKQETAEQLEAFRKQRALAEQALLEQTATAETSNLGGSIGKSAWTTQKKKRRRDKENESSFDFKSRKLSSSASDKIPTPKRLEADSSEHDPVRDTRPEQPSASSTKNVAKTDATGLGLGDYTSEEDD
jgi:hypothetical protein